MDGKVRRVVTGHDKNGKAIILSDGLHRRPTLRHCARALFDDIWRTTGMPIRSIPTSQIPRRDRAGSCRADGTVIRVSEHSTRDANHTHHRSRSCREIFKSMATRTHRHSAQAPISAIRSCTHESVDYAFVLTNEIYMLLDDSEVLLKAGDVVIQRGTNHAWSNRSKNVTRMLYV